MKLVEVIKGAKSSDESIAIGYEIAKKIKKISKSLNGTVKTTLANKLLRGKI